MPSTIQAKITNIASKADRAKSGDRLELCISKEHADLFPDHKEEVRVDLGDATWRLSCGKLDKVRHIYFHTDCLGATGETVKITQLLRSYGLDEGDQPLVRTVAPYHFELLTSTGSRLVKRNA